MAEAHAHPASPPGEAALVPVADGVSACARPFRFLGAEIGTRMTVLALEGGDLLLHSPVRFDAALRAAVERLGRVAIIAAPNRYHHLFLADWCAAFPEARLVGAPGLARKRRDLRFEGELGGADPRGELPGIDQRRIPEMRTFDEVVFLHRASGTLVVSDLVLNVESGARCWDRAFLRLDGALGRFGPSRVARAAMWDRRALRSSIDAILAWDFDRVVMAHGAVVERDGHRRLRESFAWLRA